MGNPRSERRKRARRNQRQLRIDARLGHMNHNQRLRFNRAVEVAATHHWTCGLCDLPVSVEMLGLDHVTPKHLGGCADPSDASHAKCEVQAVHHRCGLLRRTASGTPWSLPMDEWRARRDEILGEQYRKDREWLAERVQSEKLRAKLLRLHVTSPIEDGM